MSVNKCYLVMILLDNNIEIIASFEGKIPVCYSNLSDAINAIEKFGELVTGSSCANVSISCDFDENVNDYVYFIKAINMAYCIKELTIN